MHLCELCSRVHEAQISKLYTLGFYKFLTAMAMYQPPAAWIVLTPAQYEESVNKGGMDPAMFGNERGNSFRLFTCFETAWAFAREVYFGKAGAPLEQQSSWVIVKLVYTANQWCELLLADEDKDGHVTKIRPRRGNTNTLHVHGNFLNLEGVQVVVREAIMNGATVEEWGEMALSKRRKVDNVTCGECGANTLAAWLGSVGNRVEPKPYCAPCWYAYFANKEPPQ